MIARAIDPHGGRPIRVEGAPLGATPCAMILLHGRGASAARILDLVPRLDRPGFTYVAPDAADNSWYPYTFLSDLDLNEPGLTSALQVIAHLVADLGARGIPPANVILLGFSQGACLSAEFAVRHPRRYAGVMALSGALIGPPGTRWPESGALDGTPVFFGCSDVDPHIPAARVEESAAVFTRIGASVTTRFYPRMGHTVNDDEIAFVQAVMDAALARASSRG